MDTARRLKLMADIMITLALENQMYALRNAARKSVQNHWLRAH